MTKLGRPRAAGRRHTRGAETAVRRLRPSAGSDGVPDEPDDGPPDGTDMREDEPVAVRVFCGVTNAPAECRHSRHRLSARVPRAPAVYTLKNRPADGARYDSRYKARQYSHPFSTVLAIVTFAPPHISTSSPSLCVRVLTSWPPSPSLRLRQLPSSPSPLPPSAWPPPCAYPPPSSPPSSDAPATGGRPSEVIRGHQRPSEALSGNQRQSEVIRGHQRSSEVIRGHQRSSEALNGNQRQSEVMRGPLKH